MIGIRRLSISAVGLLLLTSGCASGGGPAPAASPAPTVSVAPVATPESAKELQAVLTGTLATLGQKNYAFTVSTPGMKAKGVVFQQTASAQVVSTGDGETDTADLVVAGTDRWIRLSVRSKDFDRAKSSSDPRLRAMATVFSGKTWYRVDPGKLKSATLRLDLTDITGVAGLIRHAGGGLGNARSMTGILNGTLLGAHHGLLDPAQIKSMGSEATYLPFTAAVDDQGHLTEFADEVPKSSDEPSGRWVFDFTGYGQQTTQAPPTPAQDLPATMYQFIN
jgi:hypothetical protein